MPLVAAVDAAVRAGVDWVQLRERDHDGAALLRWAGELCRVARRAAAARNRSVKILANRRIDVALAIRADGVHLGFDAVAPRAAAALMRLRPTLRGVEGIAAEGTGGEGGSGEGRGREAEIGTSAHALDEIAAAAGGGATYAHLAPIWPALSKSGTRPALGLEALASAARCGLPLFAQGGVTAQRCAAALAAGAAGVAVTGDILMARDPGRAAAALRAALDR